MSRNQNIEALERVYEKRANLSTDALAYRLARYVAGHLGTATVARRVAQELIERINARISEVTFLVTPEVRRQGLPGDRAAMNAHHCPGCGEIRPDSPDDCPYCGRPAGRPRP